MMKAIDLKFGEPSHGWLPTKLTGQNLDLEFAASDVPTDPLTQLTDVLFSVMGGNEGEVWWHLEPGGYFMNFRKIHEGYEVAITFSSDSTKLRREHICKLSGNDGNLIIPLWRSLRKFYSHSYVEPDWPECDKSGMERLTLRIRQLKNGLTNSYTGAKSTPGEQ